MLLSAQWENGTGRIGATTFTGFSGSVTVTVLVTTTYTLVVTNADGVSVSRDLTISAVPGPTITSFDQDLNNVAPGTQVTLTASWTGGSGRIGLAAFGGFSGLLTVSPQVTTTYTLIVTNSANVSVAQNLTVTVVIALPIITTFGATSTASVSRGSQVTIFFDFDGGTGAISVMYQNGTIDVFPMQGPGSDTLTAPDETVTLELKVANALGFVIQQYTIHVLPIIDDFRAYPQSVGPNQDVVLTPGFTGGTGRINGTQVVPNQQLIVRPSVTTTYTLTVTNTRGEFVTDSLTITVT